MVRFFLAILLLPACAVATARSLEDAEVRAELSSQLYATLQHQKHYFDSDAAAVAFSERLRAIATSATNAISYYRGIANSLASLEEGHTGLVSSSEVPFSSTIPPAALLEVEGLPVVAGVAPGVEGGGLRPGDLVLEVDGASAMTALSRQLRITAGSTPHGRRARATANLLAGPTNAPALVRVRGVDGRERLRYPLRFLLDDEGTNRFRFGFASGVVTSTAISDTVGYLSLPDFQAGRVEEVLEHLRALLNLPILVLDLRGNPGGRIRTLQRIAGLFLERSEVLAQLREDGRKQAIAAEPARQRYKGELRILVDERTGSAAELLAAALQDLGRARIYGRTTAGSTRSRRSSVLPGGVVFHYAGRAEFRRRDGGVLEGLGIKPDVVVFRSRKSLAEGAYGAPSRDPVVRFAAGLN